MSLSAAEINTIANLAKLQIKEEDLSSYCQNLGNILSLINEMNELDTDKITPMSHPIETSQRLRQDAISEDNKRDELQAIAPLTEDGVYLVPTVIE